MMRNDIVAIKKWFTKISNEDEIFDYLDYYKLKNLILTYDIKTILEND